jgi:hypothetical protein
VLSGKTVVGFVPFYFRVAAVHQTVDGKTVH